MSRIAHVIALNAGSSSVKFGLFDVAGAAPRGLVEGQVEMAGADRHFLARGPDGVLADDSWDSSIAFHDEAIARLLSWIERAFPDFAPLGIGHRVVHGGTEFAVPMLCDDALIDRLQRLVPLAPLHQPANLAAIAAARREWPDVAQVACFDTAFHRGHAFAQDAYALPRAYYDAGVRRYGFHGISYEYLLRRLGTIAPDLARGRIIIAHLGNGASLCAIRDGRSVASTMGFSTLDGLVMGTRCGQIDPGVLLWMMQEKRMPADEIADLLYRRSGLAGLSGLSHDMRTLEASGDPAARDAIGSFVARIRHEIGGLASAIGGIDAIVFSGGIGTNSSRIRAEVLDGMSWLGITVDTEVNLRTGGGIEALISPPKAPVRVYVLPTDEEAMIATHVAAMLSPA